MTHPSILHTHTLSSHLTLLCSPNSLVFLECRCRSPASDGTGSSYDVSVVVGGVPTTFGARWVYQAPSVTRVTPAALAPVPPSSTLVSIHGSNFGAVAGEVFIRAPPPAVPHLDLQPHHLPTRGWGRVHRPGGGQG